MLAYMAYKFARSLFTDLQTVNYLVKVKSKAIPVTGRGGL
jgi:hypothetical protein